MRLLLGMMTLLSVSLPARADDPAPPRDPEPIRSMQAALIHDWEACQAALYPNDTHAGAAKASSTVRVLETKRRKTRGTLTIGFHRQDGSEVAPSKWQRALAACVRSRFEKRKFFTGRAPISEPVALANSHSMNPVVDANGALGNRAAVRHTSDRLAEARRHCGVAKATAISARVSIATDGAATEIAITGGDASERTCIERQLHRRLRFPAVSKPASVEARG